MNKIDEKYTDKAATCLQLLYNATDMKMSGKDQETAVLIVANTLQNTVQEEIKNARTGLILE